MTYKNKTFRRAAAAAAAICLAFAFAFAEETGADKLGFGTSVTVSADETYTETAKITYTMDVNGIVTITAVDAGYKTSVVIPDTIAGGTVMAIGDNAFRWNCHYVESVTLPPNITKIGSEAFRGCDELKSINIPDKVKFIYDYAFSDCSSLTDITLPADITKIGYAAFSSCSSLTSIVIPSKVTDIGDSVFERCSSLETIFYPYDLPNLFWSSLGIDKFNTTLLAYTQDSTTNDVAVTFVNRGADIPETINGGTVKTVFIPSSLSSYTGSVPAGAAKITYEKDSNYKVTITKVEPGADQTSIVIPDTIDGGTVTAIGEKAFYNCSGLTSITLPDNITSIGISAFSGCESLTSLTIPNSVTNIGTKAFDGCSALETIFVPENVSVTNANIPSGTAKIYYKKDADGNVTVTDVEAGSDTSIEIPETIDGGKVRTIGEKAFEDCDAFTSITLPQSLTSIEESAFSGCTSLKSIDIPQNVTNIGGSAFRQCESLTSITIPSGVTTINAAAFAFCTSLRSIDLPDHLASIESNAFDSCLSLTSIDIPADVTTIRKFAFWGCTSLESVVIPMNVNSVGDRAFDGCTSLKAVFAKEGLPLESASVPSGAVKIYYQVEDQPYLSIIKARADAQTSIESIEIPETICGLDVRIIKAEAFKNCGNIKNVILPDSITEIQNGAFYECTALKSIEIPDSVKSIGESAFSGCKNLETVKLPKDLTCIDLGTFSDCTALASIVIPDKVTDIKQAAFSGCTSLESINIPQNVKSIGRGAFSSCQSLSGITIPSNVTRIEPQTFRFCMALEEIDIPDSVESIGYEAFANCTNLKSITIPFSVTSIEDRAFAFCSSVKTAYLPYGASYGTNFIPDGTAKIYFTKNPDGTVTISDVKEGNETSFVIPETICGASVTALGDAAFEVNENITSIILPDSITSIGYGAFSYCSSLQSIKLPKNITSIEINTFADCRSLTDIEIPENVTSIKAGAFRNCDRLAKVTLPDGLTELGDTAFSDCPRLAEINIPSGVKAIGERAFKSCAFAAIELPENLQSVGSDAFLDCSNLKRLFYPAGVDISAASVPETSAKIKYEIRGGYAYILEIVPDSSSTPVVIPDTIRGYKVKYVEEEYRQYVSETGHTHKGGTATCTEQALCDICGKSYDSTDLTNHDADTSTWKYDENGHWNPCLRAGCEEHLNAAAHTFDNGVVTTEPTENSEGVKTYTCEVCGYKKTETVPKLGHIPSAEWSYDNENHWKECTAEGCDEKLELAAHTFDGGVITVKPTESSEGVKTYTCEICGYKKTESIAKITSVIYPIAISGDVTADKPSAAAGETVNVSAPFGYDIIVADINGRQIAKISEKGSFTMPASRVNITAVRGEVFAHMSNAWSHSYVYSYDSDMNRIKVNSDTRRGVITIDLGADYAGRDFTVYSGRKSTSKKIISGTLDENGRYTFSADEGRNYTLVVE